MKKVMKSISVVLLSTVCLCCIFSCAKNESDDLNTQITVVISDDEQHLYPGVSIQLTSQDSTVKSGRSSAQGSFVFQNLNPGSYEITASTPLNSMLMPSDRLDQEITAGEQLTVAFKVFSELMQGTLVYDEGDIIDEIRNQTNGKPIDDSELLYARNWSEDPIGSLHPIFAPDGHHVTLGEWKNAEGTASIYCDGLSTHSDFQFSGLIPNGVYTLWIVPLSSQVTFSTFRLSDQIGMGALGGGGQNKMTASAEGEATTSINMTGGLLSVRGQISDCALTGEAGLIIILDYHIDGKSHGNFPGPDQNEVGHVLFLL